MRIHEIITESTELEEGWKSKLGAAALAGAAALGGGGLAHAGPGLAQAEEIAKAKAQQQQVNNQVNFRHIDFVSVYKYLAEFSGFKKYGLLDQKHLEIYNKVSDLIRDHDKQLIQKAQTDIGWRGFVDMYHQLGQKMYESAQQSAIQAIKREKDSLATAKNRAPGAHEWAIDRANWHMWIATDTLQQFLDSQKQSRPAASPQAKPSTNQAGSQQDIARQMQKNKEIYDREMKQRAEQQTSQSPRTPVPKANFFE